jgi:hypothetical protein
MQQHQQQQEEIHNIPRALPLSCYPTIPVNAKIKNVAKSEPLILGLVIDK